MSSQRGCEVLPTAHCGHSAGCGHGLDLRHREFSLPHKGEGRVGYAERWMVCWCGVEGVWVYVLEGRQPFFPSSYSCLWAQVPKPALSCDRLNCKRKRRWLRRWWPRHLLCIVEYIFHMLLAEVSNKGHQMLEIEQKEIKKGKKRKNSYFLQRNLPWFRTTGVVGKIILLLNSSFWLTCWKECAEQITPLLPPNSSAEIQTL